MNVVGAKTMLRSTAIGAATVIAAVGLMGSADASDEERDWFLEDAKVIAAESGGSVEDTLAMLLAQDRFVEFLATVDAEYGKSVVDHAWHGDHGSISVLASAFPAVSLASASTGAEIEVTQAADGTLPFYRRSEVELPALRAAMAFGAISAGSAYDPATNTVVVEAYFPTASRLEPSGSEALAGNVSFALEGAGVSTDVVVRYAEQAGGSTSSTYGGRQYYGCTGGFVGTKGSGYGIITAAHCDTKPSSYDGDSTGSTWTATGSRDLRFTSLSGGTPYNRIQYTAGGTWRSITSVGIMTTGITICKYGKETGYGCDTVEAYQGCFDYLNDDEFCHLYRTEDDVVEAGDSGGPWFSGSKAYGVTSGENPVWGFQATYIAPVSEVGYITGVSVKTS